MSRTVRWILVGVGSLLLAGYGATGALFYWQQRALLYLPTHQAAPAGLAPWTVDGELYGLAREAPQPRRVWLIFQGNAGQAGPRRYFDRVPADESLYILDYPGYGKRPGEPTHASITDAARRAYFELRRRFSGVPVGVVGESFGSGPACALTREPTPPDRVVLLVPIARLDLVVGHALPFLPVRLLLRDNWDNPAALRDYRGPVTIFAAEEDQAVSRAETLLLAQSRPGIRLVWVPAGHLQADADEGVALAP